jgi:hypothetical protein
MMMSTRMSRVAQLRGKKQRADCRLRETTASSPETGKKRGAAASRWILRLKRRLLLATALHRLLIALLR